MAAIVTEICSILVSGIQTLGTGIAGGVTNMVQALFVSGTGTTGDPYALSITGGVIAVFGAIALAVSLTTKLYNWVMSLGAR